ncbi:PDZ and LIM domain 5 [Phyllostomus discolor]|uniref:PDZ and LIM domain 5 n=1 Tax=Phyllostomus discolor TaxID=89673 RepID=A0A834EWN4_9CHIR|nr:PDZ and LIM domain 5 [Phyllostomus discolor]
MLEISSAAFFCHLKRKTPPKRPPRKHIVERNTEFYHIPTHSDASKKRLIEDTEDWHPRTGTTQSRSFRILAQITGTEHLKESETDNTKKANNTQEPSQPFASSVASAQRVPERPESPAFARPGVASLTTATAFKPVGSTSSVKSPSWQRPNQAELTTEAFNVIRQLLKKGSSTSFPLKIHKAETERGHSTTKSI